MGLDLVEIVLEAEDEFGVPIDGDNVPLFVGDLLNATLTALRKHRPERFVADAEYADTVWQQLKEMIAEQLGVEPERVLKSANFVTDLGCV